MEDNKVCVCKNFYIPRVRDERQTIVRVKWTTKVEESPILPKPEVDECVGFVIFT